MKRLLQKVQAALTAAAFAEEGDADTARRIVAEAEVDEKAGDHRAEPVARPSGHRAPVTKGSAA